MVIFYCGERTEIKIAQEKAIMEEKECHQLSGKQMVEGTEARSGGGGQLSPLVLTLLKVRPGLSF